MELVVFLITLDQDPVQTMITSSLILTAQSSVFGDSLEVEMTSDCAVLTMRVNLWSTTSIRKAGTALNHPRFVMRTAIGGPR
jgi:hypothetical protein